MLIRSNLIHKTTCFLFPVYPIIFFVIYSVYTFYLFNQGWITQGRISLDMERFCLRVKYFFAFQNQRRKRKSQEKRLPWQRPNDLRHCYYKKTFMWYCRHFHRHHCCLKWIMVCQQALYLTSCILNA